VWVQLERGEREAIDRETDRALVGMKEVVLVPVHPEESNRNGKEKENSQPPKVSARFRHFLTLPFSSVPEFSVYWPGATVTGSRGSAGIARRS
jgi:hypothetical protein